MLLAQFNRARSKIMIILVIVVVGLIMWPIMARQSNNVYNPETKEFDQQVGAAKGGGIVLFAEILDILVYCVSVASGK
jgi:hypothetical protein